MFINIINFPPIRPGKDAEFREMVCLVKRGVRKT